MDNRNRANSNDHLGVNKFGKNIRKSPLHQPNFANAHINSNTARQQSQPQVYNINKNDFRDIVQQLTGSPARDPLPRPVNSPKPQSQRLQKIRPPPLTPLNRPPIPMHHPGPGPAPGPGPHMGLPLHVHYNNNVYARPQPPPPHQFVQPSPQQMPPPQYGQGGANIAESPVSLYMRYLQNSMMDSSGPGQQPQGQPQPGLLPNPRISGPPHPPLLPSPTSQFLLPSPSGFLNLASPRSPYPLLSPGYQFPPPLSPNFNFGFPPPSPNFGFPQMGQSGILGPGPQPPVSPGISFPLSPGFFPISSPRWRDQTS